MNKKIKKKVNKKFLTFGILGLFAIALASAALVPYLSNYLSGEVSVESPVTISVEGEDTYSLSLYPSESISVDTLTEIHIDGLTGHIAENKITDFDGEGISIEFRVDAYPGIFEIPLCIVGGDAYFYIGDPTETLDKGSFTSTTTFITELGLEPGVYEIVSEVIMFESAACDEVPSPVFVAD